MGLPDKSYTKEDVDRARTTGKVVGWVQGAAVIVLGGMVLNLVGWIPALVVLGAVGYFAYRLLSR